MQHGDVMVVVLRWTQSDSASTVRLIAPRMRRSTSSLALRMSWFSDCSAVLAVLDRSLSVSSSSPSFSLTWAQTIVFTSVQSWVKVGFLYSAAYAMTGPARFTISEVTSWLAWANGAAAQTAAIQVHALTYNWTRGMQLANTPPLQSTAPGLHPVSIHQTSPLVRGSKHPITAYY